MKPDRKIPKPIYTLEGHHIRHFITTAKMAIPYREKFHIILRRFRAGSRAIHEGFVINIRHLIPHQ